MNEYNFKDDKFTITKCCKIAIIVIVILSALLINNVVADEWVKVRSVQAMNMQNENLIETLEFQCKYEGDDCVKYRVVIEITGVVVTDCGYKDGFYLYSYYKMCNHEMLHK